MKDEDKKKIWELAQQGLSDEKISEVVFYSENYIKAIRLEAGIVRQKGVPIRYPVEVIREKIQAGIDKRIIAKEMGCSLSLVEYHIRAMRRGE
ncbi:MAG: hypothetical protein IKD59_04215 [Lachnospiraceae bacterium]|nr:hypothetical protein [Lachnospiraceae bacterium]